MYLHRLINPATFVPTISENFRNKINEMIKNRKSLQTSEFSVFSSEFIAEIFMFSCYRVLFNLMAFVVTGIMFRYREPENELLVNHFSAF